MKDQALSAVSTGTTIEPRTTCDAVITAVAEAAGVPATRLAPPLATAVDPDALESLFASSPTGPTRSGRIEFDYAGYHVTVRCEADDVAVDVDEPSDR